MRTVVSLTTKEIRENIDKLIDCITDPTVDELVLQDKEADKSHVFTRTTMKAVIDKASRRKWKKTAT